MAGEVINYDPFAAPAPKAKPKGEVVNYDPFAAPAPAPKAKPKGEVINYDPFAAPAQPRATPAQPPQVRKAAQPKPEGTMDRIGHVVAGVENSVGKAFQAAPGSAWNAAKGIYETVRHPIQSAQAISDLGLGAVEAGIRGVTGRDMKPKRGETADTAAARRVPHAQAFKPYQDSYGSLKGVKKKFETDPVGLALDASVVAGGATGLAGRLGKAGEAAEAGRAASVAKPAGPVRTAMRKVLNPGAVDDHARAMAPIQRQVLARHRLDAERAAAQLEKHQHVVGNAPVADQRAVIGAVENASRGGIEALPGKYRPAAKAIRDVALKYRARIESVMKKNGGEGPGFVEDYYARMWKQKPSEVVAAFGKQGSGKNLKARSIPTYQDGLDAGLTPVHENPLDGMTAYVDNMSRYLATHDLHSGMRAKGLAKWVDKTAVPEGWAKLNGINTEREGKGLSREIKGLPGAEGMREHTGDLPPKVLAAPEGAARIYNNYISKARDNPLAKAYETGSRVASQSALGLSGFHPTLIGGKAIGSELSVAANRFFRGEPLKGAKALAFAPFAPAVTASEGSRMAGRLLEGDAAMTETDHLFVDAGGRVSADSVYRAGVHPNMFRSLARGTLKRDLADAIGRTYKGKALENAKGIVDLGVRVADTLNAPVFQYYVPAIKRGVFDREMTEWLRTNPDAPAAAKAAEATRILDSIDNRMGEMARDNHFWHAKDEQLARWFLLSPSWNIGNVRMVADALGDLPASAKSLIKKKGLQGPTAAVAGVIASSLLMNGVANYISTGKAPEGEDWMAFRTGGTNADGTPERAMVPSSTKDAYALGYDFPNNVVPEIENKAHPFLKTIGEVVANKDWKGQPILRPPHARESDASRETEGSRLDQAGRYLASKGPMSLQDNPNGDTSGIGALGQFMGLRPVGVKYSNPERDMRNQEYFETKAWNAKVRGDRKAAQRKKKAAP